MCGSLLYNTENALMLHAMPVFKHNDRIENTRKCAVLHIKKKRRTSIHRHRRRSMGSAVEILPRFNRGEKHIQFHMFVCVYSIVLYFVHI